MSNKNLTIGLVIAIVIAIGGWFTPFGQQVTSDATQKAGQILDTFTGSYFQSGREFNIGDSRAGIMHTAGGVITCGSAVSVANVTAGFNTAISPPGAVIAPGVCNVTSSSASSTVIAVGPFTATSTITLLNLSGFNGATTTDMVVATSTTPAPATGTGTSTIAENIMGLAGVTNATQFFSTAGVTLGSTKGYTNPAGGSYRTNGSVVVGVGDYLLVFSTSTNPVTNGGTGSSQVAVPSNITLKLEYQY